MKSDLGWVVKIPTPSCPKCGKEGVEPIAGLINRDQIACSFCGATIYLASDEWRAYLKEAIDAIDKLREVYGKVP